VSNPKYTDLSGMLGYPRRDATHAFLTLFEEASPMKRLHHNHGGYTSAARPGAGWSRTGFINPFIGTTLSSPSAKGATEGRIRVAFGGIGKIIGGETELPTIPRSLIRRPTISTRAG
jgi:hypothetical protein